MIAARAQCAPHADMRVKDVERRRRALGVSHAALCYGAGVHYRTWAYLRAGAQMPKGDTITRLRNALVNLNGKPGADHILALHRAAMALAALLTGKDPAVMLAQDFSAERPEWPDWLAASRLRRLTVYVLTVELGVKNAVVGRAIGLSRQRVKQMRDEVEDLRDADPGIATLATSASAATSSSDD